MYLSRRLRSGLARWLTSTALLALVIPAAQAGDGPCRRIYQPDCAPVWQPSERAAAPYEAPLTRQTPAPGQAQTQPPASPLATAPAEQSLPEAQFAATGGTTAAFAQSSVGYIDNAIPWTGFRLRFDAAWGNNRPDRAEFFYAKCGCFRFQAPGTPGFDPNAPGPGGPGLAAANVDYQDVSAYVEARIGERFSVFVEAPWRFVNFDVLPNTNGFADMNVGFKYALFMCEETVLSAQLRAYLPTGDADRGLGTENVNLEPGLLFYHQLSDRLTFESELRDWIAIGGTDFSGNVLRYGAGLSYAIYQRCDRSIRPVAELVGWTVLGGKELNALGGTIQSASGDTIVNAKLGVRAFLNENNSLYVGYGRALTGEVWYKDILRVEYRMAF